MRCGASRRGGHLAALLALVTSPDLIGTVGVGAGDTTVKAVVDFYGVHDVATMPRFSDSLPPFILAELEARGETPPEPFDTLFGGSPYPRNEAERLCSPISHVRADAPPFLLVHGEADGLVPIVQSERFNDALRAAGTDSELVRVPGADHVFLGTDPAPQIERALDFLRARL